MVVDPAPVILTRPVELFTVATAVFELVKLQMPLLFVDGLVRSNDASPYVLLGMTKVPNVGDIASTTNVAVTDFDK